MGRAHVLAGNYSRLACEFYLTRRLGYYVIHIYVPSCLIVVLSWISFWLHRDASPARVALGITTVLTMTTVLSSSNASLPKISYLKSIDIYLVTCFVMVFASLLEYACVSFLGRSRSSASSGTSSSSISSGGGNNNSNSSSNGGK
jgi:gamma-aminobutyric acid receptor subunit beta